MLNKIRSQILPMLDTLGEALGQYCNNPADDLLDGIVQFIDAIDAPIENECLAVVAISELLKESLKNPMLSEIERLYNEYYTAVENLPIQYKAVFLSYYDNTWDSLASVYEAFAANPMFATEIVIIPIRRNTPSGWKTVYEDYLTPLGIPNTPFSDYSFEKDLPDFVFYNNPYDGVNIEKFQSHNIKPHTGCMVFIPYFLYQHSRQDKAGLKGETEQFTHLPGHDNADIFITQGGSFMKTFARRSRNGSKMIALGNPKTDNIYRHMQDYPRYPEWDKATSGKTVFLLNTHYQFAFDSFTHAFLPYLLDLIEQNDDLALIWRPHPQTFLMLNKNGTTVKNPELQNCLERVQNHERMILDRTASVISAIMYSDAVLSQLSSVVSESIFTDKPVFLLCWNPEEVYYPKKWSEIDAEKYMEKLARIRKYDIDNLFLFSATCHQGVTQNSLQEIQSGSFMKPTMLEFMKTSMLEFMNDIRNGVDSKKELRVAFRKQLFVNGDGTCGQKIHDYIVGLINA